MPRDRRPKSAGPNEPTTVDRITAIVEAADKAVAALESARQAAYGMSMPSLWAFHGGDEALDRARTYAARMRSVRDSAARIAGADQVADFHRDH